MTGRFPTLTGPNPSEPSLKGAKIFITLLKEEKEESTSRVVVLGVPVGPRYRPYVSQGLVDCIATVLKGEKWPQLVLEVKEKKKGMF